MFVWTMLSYILNRLLESESGLTGRESWSMNCSKCLQPLDLVIAPLARETSTEKVNNNNNEAPSSVRFVVTTLDACLGSSAFGR